MPILRSAGLGLLGLLLAGCGEEDPGPPLPYDRAPNGWTTDDLVKPADVLVTAGTLKPLSGNVVTYLRAFNAAGDAAHCAFAVDGPCYVSACPAGAMAGNALDLGEVSVRTGDLPYLSIRPGAGAAYPVHAEEKQLWAAGEPLWLVLEGGPRLDGLRHGFLAPTRLVLDGDTADTAATGTFTLQRGESLELEWLPRPVPVSVIVDQRRAAPADGPSAVFALCEFDGNEGSGEIPDTVTSRLLPSAQFSGATTLAIGGGAVMNVRQDGLDLHLTFAATRPFAAQVR